MYKIETHLHTVHTSKCGHLDAKTLVSAYKAAGYDAVCVTDHYNRNTVGYLNMDLAKTDGLLDLYLNGYYKVCAEAEKVGLRVYRGAELRFDECDNDYLLYGWPDQLLADMGAVMRLSVVDFAKLYRKTDAVMIQAHPYRKSCTPAIYRYIDGVEVYNGNPRHENNNALARRYAEDFDLIGTSGSDCHQTPDIALGGITVDSLPENDAALADLLRSRNFGLITPVGEE